MEENILKAEDLISPDWLEIYLQQRECLYRELVTLNTRLFTLEKLEQFPVRVLFPLYQDRIWWQTFRNALIEATILVMWRIVFDSRKDVLTLKGFKEGIRDHLRDEDAKRLFPEVVRQVDFESLALSLENKVKDARNNYLAHLNRERQLNPEPQKMADMAISLEELKSILDASFRLFRTLSFEVYPNLWLWDYHDRARSERNTDIDRLLDGVAEGSLIMHLPETDPRTWRNYRTSLSSTELERLNEYRIRLGLAPTV